MGINTTVDCEEADHFLEKSDRSFLCILRQVNRYFLGRASGGEVVESVRPGSPTSRVVYTGLDVWSSLWHSEKSV